MAKASDLNALAKLTGGNKLDGSQVITSDNAGFILGKNSDLALLKKQGQGGTIAVGSGTPFRVQRSRATTVSPADTFDDILVIGTNNQTTLPGDLVVGGGFDNTAKGKLYSQALELSMSTPYIDFHFNGSIADFTARIIQDLRKQTKYSGQCQLVSYRWQFNRWLNNARQYRSRPAGHRRTCAVSDVGKRRLRRPGRRIRANVHGGEGRH